MYDPPVILSEPTCAVQVAVGAVLAVLVGEALELGAMGVAEPVSLAEVGVAEGLPRRLSASELSGEAGTGRT